MGEGVVATVAVLSGEGMELVGEGIEFRGEGAIEDEEFVVEDFCIETGMVSGERAMDTVEGVFVAGVDEEAIEEVEEIVTGGAGDGPIIGQLFAVAEDFFDEDPGG